MGGPLTRPPWTVILVLLLLQFWPATAASLSWSSPVLLTNNTITNALPSISLDGSKIAYQANPAPLRDWQIFSMNSDGTGIRQLTNSTASNFSPSISGNGTLIVFFSDLTVNFEIYRVNSDGTGLRRLTNSFPYLNSYPVISADGSTVAFQSNRTGNLDIFAMRSDGSLLRQLTFNKTQDEGPSISADGSLIAFVSNVTSGGQIFAVRSDGSQPPFRLTTNACKNQSPVISRDGRYVVFQSNCTGIPQIWRVRTDGSHLMQLTNSPLGNQLPSINYDGSLVAYEGTIDAFGDSEIFVANVNVVNGAVSIDQLTFSSPPAHNGPGSISGGGIKVAYQSDINGLNTEVFIVQGLFSRDVAVTGMAVSRSFAYSGVSSLPIILNVTVADLGGISENLTVTVWANSTLIGTKAVALNAGASGIVSFSWNAQLLSRGNYVLSARVSPVPGETNLANNALTSGTIFTVRLAGDVNNDCAVNFIDLGRVGSAFLTVRGQLGYDPEADLNNDGVVNFVDLGVVGANFLRRCA